MRAAANALALCALLALTSLPARCQHDQAFTEDDEAEPLCENSLMIRVCGDHGLFCKTDVSSKVSIAYGTGVKVECIGTASLKSLTISRNGKKLISDKSYYGNVRVTSKLDPPASEDVIKCTDIETTCERSVIIMITPVFEVISPNVEICKSNIKKKYTVQYGNSMSVLCSGPDAARLVMTKDGKTLPTERANDTTIKSFDRTPDLQKSEYVCTDVETTYNSSAIIQVVPKIYFQSRNQTITPYYYYYGGNCNSYVKWFVYFVYSGPIDVFCSGSRAVNLTDNDYTILLAENFNKNTVFINITKLGWAEYTCSDRKLPDYVSKVRVSVIPQMEVVSPGASIVLDNYGASTYTVTYEHPLEILCSGPDASRVIIHTFYAHINNGVEQTVNNSTIRYILKEPMWEGYAIFTCTERGKIMEEASVVVGVLPAVKKFHCVSYDVQFLNCSWTGIKNEAKYTLFYVENGILTRICEKRLTSSLSEFCVWQYENDSERANIKVLNFLIQSCGNVGCYNQTFHIDHLRVKLAPPERLKVLRTTSRGAVLQWDVADLKFEGAYFFAKRGDFHYKVQYWYSGIELRTVNSSLVTCTAWNCKIELNLPCPGKFYEVSIYQKLKRSVGGMWSYSSSKAFKTDGEDGNTKNNNPKCNQGLIKTKEVMRYIVQKLREEMLPEIEPMKQKVRPLQDKLDNIRKYVASTKEQNGQS